MVGWPRPKRRETKRWKKLKGWIKSEQRKRRG